MYVKGVCGSRWRRHLGCVAQRLCRKETPAMDPLRIVSSEANPHEASRSDSFDLHLSRPMTHFEQAAISGILSKFALTEVKGPQIVTMNGASIGAIESNKRRLQELVAEAEALASKNEQAQSAAGARRQAGRQDAAQRATEIDWDA